VPKHRAERAANHCAAARQIDQLDVIILTFVRDFCTLADQAMAVLDAAVRPASRFAADGHSVERFELGALGLLGAHERILGRGNAAEYLRSDVHAFSVTRARRYYAPRMVTESCTLMEKAIRDAGGEKGKVGGFPPPASRKGELTLKLAGIIHVEFDRAGVVSQRITSSH